MKPVLDACMVNTVNGKLITDLLNGTKNEKINQ